jgi:hypothetical protein
LKWQKTLCERKTIEEEIVASKPSGKKDATTKKIHEKIVS